jgi:hypothetical protein
LVKHANSLISPGSKLCPSYQIGGTMGVWSKEGMVAIGAWFIGSIVINICALRICYTWNSSQSPKRSHWRRILVFQCPTNPPIRGGVRHHCGNKRNKC